MAGFGAVPAPSMGMNYPMSNGMMMGQTIPSAGSGAQVCQVDFCCSLDMVVLNICLLKEIIMLQSSEKSNFISEWCLWNSWEPAWVDEFWWFYGIHGFQSIFQHDSNASKQRPCTKSNEPGKNLSNFEAHAMTSVEFWQR